MAKPERFTDVELRDQYPQNDVADHEVFMSFRNDDDAAFFREWWEDEGAVAFGKWLSERSEVEQ